MPIKVTMMRCYLTFLANVTSQAKNQGRMYTYTGMLDLALAEDILSYVPGMNHLMVKKNANQMQIKLVIVSQLILMVSTCLLTIKIINSQ